MAMKALGFWRRPALAGRIAPGPRKIRGYNRPPRTISLVVVSPVLCALSQYRMNTRLIRPEHQQVLRHVAVELI